MIDRIPNDVIEVLKGYDWPGNVRELQNVTERAVIMATGSVLDLQTTELRTQKVEAPPITTFADAQRAHIVATLRETNWVIGGQHGAAAQLGLARTTRNLPRDITTASGRIGSTIRNSAERAGRPHL
jgi:transcriptional regulator of acetoin/glycerol metabolism